jgi:pilus assembly protein CpaC
MSRRVLQRSLALAAAVALAAEGGASAQSAFPRTALQPSPYAGRELAGPPPAAASAPAAAVPGGAQTVRIDLSGPAGPSRMMALPKGKSAVIELPVDARDVLVSNPQVADVVLSTPRRIYVLGSNPGQTDAVFFDATGRQILNLNIRVDQDVSSLLQTLNRVIGNSSVRVEALNDRLILSGEVANAAEADRAVRLAQAVVAKPDLVINMLSIAGPEQVMLKVRIVEVDRTVVKQLGVNLNAVYNQIGEPQLMFGTASTFGVNGALLGGLTGGYNLDTTKNPAANPVSCNYAVSPAQCVTLPQEIIDRDYKLSGIKDGAGSAELNKAEAMLKAFERVGMVRTLAEPNLTAVSGEAAKFLAGGEFPVPTGQDNNGRVSIEFKPFGVGLGFTPVVLSNGRISLKLSTEFSELTNIGAFSLTNGTSSSVVVPGLNVRRTETTVELPSGGGMMISGLLQNVTKQTIDSLPGLMQLPVLGALFRSRDFVNNESELVVIVTPYLVKPADPKTLQTPADGLMIATDLQTTLLGRLNQAFGRGPARTPAGSYQGPYGYVVD